MSFHPDRWGRSTLHVGKHWPVSNTGCRTPGECDDFSRCIGCMLRQAHEEGAAIAAGIIALGLWGQRMGVMQRIQAEAEAETRCTECGRLRTPDSVGATGVCRRCRLRGTP